MMRSLVRATTSCRVNSPAPCAFRFAGPVQPSVRRLKSTALPVVIIVLLCSAGCAANAVSMYPTDASVRAAFDTPGRFLVGSVDPAGVLTQPQRDGACRNPMVDPRDGTRLRLVQSRRDGDDQIGDYEPPEGRYGVRPGELLRLNCGTGEAIGIVPPHA